MNIAGKLLEIFEKNPNRAFEFKELHNTLGGNYASNYTALRYLVKCKNIVEAWPGLNGGRKKTYFKRTKEYNDKRNLSNSENKNFCKDCVNDFDDPQMCKMCKNGSHQTLSQ